MNLLLYYPRLLSALVVQPVPKSLSGLHHWNMAQLFLLWNEPWHDESDSFAMHAVMISRRASSVDPSDGKVRRAAIWLRIVYLFAICYWPLLALLISLRKRGVRFVPYWNQLVDNMFLFLDRPDFYDPKDANTITHLSLYVPLLYFAARTGQRFPDRKDEMAEACRRLAIPTPRRITAETLDGSPGSYIVKPIGGFGANGITYTTDPAPHVGDAKVVVQEVVRNPIELRRFWGTDTLGTIRMMTVKLGNRIELAGPPHLKIPIGDSNTDNFCQGNVYSMIDDEGRLSTLYATRDETGGSANHPTTGIAAADIVIPNYQDCVQLAIAAHQKLAPYAPFFNADVAITEDGPMLIEVNKIPGLPSMMFEDGVAEKFVRATNMALKRVSPHQARTRVLGEAQCFTPAALHG